MLKRKFFYWLTISNFLYIIVLLILAGVTIAMLTGENGILNKATTAKEKTEEKTAEERVKLEVAGSFDNTGKYNADLAKENLENNLGATVTKNEDGSLGVTYEGYDFKIDINGEASEANYFKLSIISDTGDQGEHTLGIDEQGNLWAWGANSYGQLGNGTTTNSSIPIKIKGEIKFIKIDSGGRHSLAIDEQGNIWTWGRNWKGELGDGTTTDNSTPAKILEKVKFKEISAGLNYSLGIDEEGILWTWGQNWKGQLGNGTTTDSSTPAKILENIKFKKISAGLSHSLAIDEEGNLWAWGNNQYGQLGNGSTSYNANPTPIKILETIKFKDISSGDCHSLAIDEEGNLWAWGSNSSGQLGNGTTTNSSIPIKIKEGTKFRKIAAGYYFTLAIDEQGNLWAWGSNSSGQLGNGTTTDSSIPIKIKEEIKFKEVATGSTSGRPYSVVIDIEGNVWTAGNNQYGQLGRKTDEDAYGRMKSSYTFQRIEIDE